MARNVTLGPPPNPSARRPFPGGTRGDMIGGNKTTFPNPRPDNVFLDVVTSPFGGVAFTITALQIIAIVVLIKCKKMSYQIKYFSGNYLLANTFYNIMDTGYLLINVSPFGKTAWAKALGRPIMTFAAGVSWCSMALLAIERVMVLQLSLKYQLTVTKKRVAVAIAGTWLANLVIFLSIMFATVAECNDWSLTDCITKHVDRNATMKKKEFKIGVRISMSIYAIYSIVLIVTIVKLHIIIKKHLKYVSQFKSTAATTTNKDKQKTSRFVLKLQVAHLLLHIPVMVNFIAFETESDGARGTVRWTRNASQLALFLHAFLTLALYFWNLRECRLVFLTMFCRCFSCGRKRIQKLRARIYGSHFIDPNVKNSRNRKQCSDTATCTSTCSQMSSLP